MCLNNMFQILRLIHDFLISVYKCVRRFINCFWCKQIVKWIQCVSKKRLPKKLFTVAFEVISKTKWFWYQTKEKKKGYRMILKSYQSLEYFERYTRFKPEFYCLKIFTFFNGDYIKFNCDIKNAFYFHITLTCFWKKQLDKKHHYSRFLWYGIKGIWKLSK